MAIVLVVGLVVAFSGIALAGVGNDAPSGSHYNLNIIGVQNPKNQNMNCGNGHRIFVGLNKSGDRVTTRILLTQGDSFAVLDCNGTDDGWAEFQLPAPAPGDDPEEETLYTVWIRVPGNRKNFFAEMALCGGYFEDPNDKTSWVEVQCNDPITLPITGKKQKFTNVTRELLFLVGYGWIFNGELENYLWEYDNYGLKLVQIRLYPKM